MTTTIRAARLRSLPLACASLILLAACGSEDSTTQAPSRATEGPNALQAALLASGLGTQQAAPPQSLGFDRRPELAARDGVLERELVVDTLTGRPGLSLPLTLRSHSGTRIQALYLQVGGASGARRLDLAEAEAAELALDLDLEVQAASVAPEGFCFDLALEDALARVSAPLRQCALGQAGARSVVAPAAFSALADSELRLAPLRLDPGLAARWTVLGVEGTPTPELSDDGDAVRFTPAAGRYLLRVEAGGQSDLSRLTVRAQAPLQAEAGADRRADAGETLTLWGDASAAADSVQFAWTREGQPAGDTRDLTINPQAADIGRSLVYTLTVTPIAGGESGSDSVTVQVRDPANLPPTADAGRDQTAGEGARVQLDGRGSRDLDSDTLDYAWAQVIPPGEPTPRVELENADTAQPSFVAPTVDSTLVLEFELTVRDANGNADSDRMQVTVENDIEGGN